MAPVNADDLVNQRDAQNRTPLHVNVFENRPTIVKNLLQRGADISLTSNKGNTPLHTAASRKYPHMVELLLKYSSREKIKKCINAKTTESGSAALHVAASNGCVASVRHLLTYGANFEVRNRAGKRPIDVATDAATKQLLVNVEMDSKLAAAGKHAALKPRMWQYSLEDLLATTRARNDDGWTSLQQCWISIVFLPLLAGFRA